MVSYFIILRDGQPPTLLYKVFGGVKLLERNSTQGLISTFYTFSSTKLGAALGTAESNFEYTNEWNFQQKLHRCTLTN